MVDGSTQNVYSSHEGGSVREGVSTHSGSFKRVNLNAEIADAGEV